MAKPGIFTRMRRAIASAWAEKASKVGPMIARILVGQAVWPKRDYEKLGREGYQQNPVVYACIALIAKSVADIPWVMYQGRGDKAKELEAHDFLDMLDRPNPLQDRIEFLRTVITQYMLSGNAYIERTDEKNFGRMELYAHRADRIKIIPGETGVPMGYLYEVNGQRRTFDVDPDKGLLPILHLKTVNPVDDWYGQSPLDACSWAIDIHNGSSQQTRSIQENDGAPAGALVFEGSTEGGNTYSAEEGETVLARLRGEDHGYDRKGSRMLLQGGKHVWLPFGLDPDKAEALETKNQAAREIAFTLGVPPMLLGIPGDNTYSNYQEARQAFYQETVIPLVWLIARAINHWFALSLGKNVYLEPNIDEIDALQLSRTEQWTRVVNCPVLSTNEKREAIGYEPVDGGDELMVGMGQIPMSMASSEFMGGSAEEDDLSDMLEDDPEAEKKKPNGSKHMPSGAVHRRAD